MNNHFIIRGRSKDIATVYIIYSPIINTIKPMTICIAEFIAPPLYAASYLL